MPRVWHHTGIRAPRGSDVHVLVVESGDTVGFQGVGVHPPQCRAMTPHVSTRELSMAHAAGRRQEAVACHDPAQP